MEEFLHGRNPQIVYEYNHGMALIDGTDQIFYTYLNERRMMKHFKKVLFNIFGGIILNTYVLYKINTGSPLSRLHFQISIVEAVAEEWLSSATKLVTLAEEVIDHHNLRILLVLRNWKEQEKNILVFAVVSVTLKEGGGQKLLV